MYPSIYTVKDKTKWRVSLSKKRTTQRQQFALQYINSHLKERQLEEPTSAKIISKLRIKSKENSIPKLNRTAQNYFMTPSLIRNTSTKKIIISEDQKSRLYNVFPKHLNKIQILGKGAASVIWLAYDTNLQKKVAVKQFLKDCKQSYQRQKRFVKQLENNHQATKNFIKYNYWAKIGPADFIVYELGGKSLSKSLYQIKGQFYNSERVYKIIFSDLYWQIIKPNKLKKLIKQLAESVQYLILSNFAHNDLKPENILIDQECKIKICDYGSVTQLRSSEVKNMITPQYMPPQVLMGFESGLVDVWSIGIIIVELLNGIPIWMSYKCWIEQRNLNILSSGLLAVKGKNYTKIIGKLKYLTENLRQCIQFGTQEYKASQIDSLLHLLKRILDLNPQQRYTPEDILSHKFLKGQ